MPPKPRRKGPAHQNTFAYRHNPNSKKTKQILESPNVHVCRRCHEKIEWRKQYRKYKPRTQLGNCICCRLKRVTAAYHTICEPCTRTSAKARTLLDEWNNPIKQQPTEEAEKETVEQGGKEQQQEENPATEQSSEMEETSGVETQIELSKAEPAEEPDKDDDDDDDDDPTSDEPRQRRVYRRVCAMCVKEPALPGESDEEDQPLETFKHLDRPLKLRELKRLERMAEKKSNRRRTRPEEENEELDEADPQQDGEEDDDEEDNDPLLQAVGGADQLLTGEAYQAKLLKHAAK
eukprot:scaffold5169_cov172-Amphora_coffeaeformis.AAC.32